MKSKKLALSLNLIVVLTLLFGLVLPSVFVNTATDVAYAAADSYYSSITAKTGTSLLGQVHDLMVSTHSYYTSYNDVKAKSYITDPGSGSNTVMEFYSHTDISNSNFDNNGGWNREHVWAQSISNGLWGTSGAGSDLHHIRPAEKDLNNRRGSKKYGNVTNGKAEYTSVTNHLGGYSDSSTFMPLDFAKGDVARIIMYVYTHYNNASNVGGTKESAKTHGNLPIRNIVTASSDDAAWKILLAWNKLDPVDDIERTRNEEVYKLQGNRNAFIDHPEYADAIWGGATLGQDELQSLTLNSTAFTLMAGQTQTLSVSATPSNANASVTWSSSNTSVATVVNGVVTAKSMGTATITATSTTNSNIKATATVTVKGATAIELVGEPNKKVYDAGQTFVPTGLTVKLIYSDGSYETYSTATELAKFSWVDASTGATALSANASKIKCKYGNLEVVSDWEIIIKAMTGIEIMGEPANTTYDIGDTFDPTGLTVVAHYNDGTTHNLALSELTWLDSATDSAYLDKNTTTVKCVYGSFTDVSVWSVTVKYVAAIELSGAPVTTDYMVGQTFNPLGVIVKLVYSDNSFKEYDTADGLAEFTWVDADTDSEILVATTTKIKVKYQELSQVGEWTVTVQAPPDNTIPFVTSVGAINDETTLRGKFDAIKAALKEYSKLSETDKETENAVNAYRLLQQSIADYNESAAQQNEVMEKATKTGAYAICGVTLAAAALVAVLKRKFN